MNPTKKIYLYLFFAIFIFYFAFQKPIIFSTDGHALLDVSESIVLNGSLSVTNGPFARLGAGGYFYSIKYPLTSFLAVPFVWGGLLVSKLVNLPLDYAVQFFALFLPLTCMSLTGVVLFSICRQRGCLYSEAFWVLVIFVFGTVALVYSREFWPDVLLSCITALIIQYSFSERKTSNYLLGLLIAMAILAKPTGIVMGVITSGYFFLKQNIKRGFLCLASVVTGIAIYAFYNYLRFESFFDWGYSISGNFEFLKLLKIGERMLFLLFSPAPGGGLILYCPILIVLVIYLRRIISNCNMENLYLCFIFGGYLFLYALWTVDSVGWDWGCRFLLPTIVPLLVIIAQIVTLINKRLLVLLIVVGFLINAPTLVCFYERVYSEYNDNGNVDKVITMHGEWCDTPIVQIWQAAYKTIDAASRNDVKTIIQNVETSVKTVHTARSFKIIPIWWWFLPFLGLPKWSGLLVAVALVFLSVWFFRAALRLMEVWE